MGVREICSNVHEVILSICIPTYNRKNYLRCALDSIISDGLDSNVEILISDNASTDGTLELVKDFIQKGHNITYLRNEVNIGPDGNILKCIQNAKGKFIQLMGDDDILASGAVEYILNFLKKHTDISTIALNWDQFKKIRGKEIYYNPRYQDVGQTLFDSREQFLKTLSLEGLSFLSNKIYNSYSIKKLDNLEDFIGTRFLQSYALILCLEQNSNAAIIRKVLVHQGVLNNLPHQMSPEEAIYSATVVFHDKLYSLLNFMKTEIGINENAVDYIFYNGSKFEWRVMLLLRFYYSIKPSISFGIEFNKYYRRYKSVYYFGIFLSIIPLFIVKFLTKTYYRLFLKTHEN